MTHSAEWLCSRRAALFTSGNPAGRGLGGGRAEAAGRRPPSRSPPRWAGSAALAPGAGRLTPSRCAAAPEWLPRAVNGHQRLVNLGQSNCGPAGGPTGTRKRTAGGDRAGRSLGAGRPALMTDPGNVPDTLVHFLVNVFALKERGMLYITWKCWLSIGPYGYYWVSTTCNQSKRNIKKLGKTAN